MNTNNIYNISYSKLVRWLIPLPLRKPKLLAFVNALVSGSVGNLYTRFTTYRTNTLYWLSITPQVCRMQKALNDRWDIDQRRIIITDGQEEDPLVLYQKAENKPVTLYTKGEGPHQILFTKAEVAMFTADFFVWVPYDIIFDLNEMTAFVKSLKLPGKTFLILRA